MEDDLICFKTRMKTSKKKEANLNKKNGRQPQQKMEDDLKKNGRRPQKKNGQPKAQFKNQP